MIDQLTSECLLEIHSEMEGRLWAQKSAISSRLNLENGAQKKGRPG